MKARWGNKNGRWKGVPDEAKHFMLTGYLSGSSEITLAYQWNVSHDDKIDCRRIRRWLLSEGVTLRIRAKKTK